MNQTDTVSTGETPSRKEVWRMFDRIAGRYDLLNRMLSFGRDVAWRKRMARRLRGEIPLKVMDLATGTADQILFMHRQGVQLCDSVGVDMSEGMLEVGRKKVADAGLDDRIELIRGDATDIPLGDAMFDVASISFGIRNVIDVDKGLREMHRVLRPGGGVFILESSLPRNRFIRSGYLFYFRHILPRIGGIVSGDAYAYNYLNKTVETFPYGAAFCDLMRNAGFREVTSTPLTFGVASLYEGTKPE